MPAAEVTIDEAALREIVAGPGGRDVLTTYANKVRDRARANATPISTRLASAIWTDDVGTDKLGTYIDVGYNKAQPGWVLWFHEFGTIKVPAQPHLRPALYQS